MIGYLRGDFGNGQEFYTTWFDQNEARKTNTFQAELDEVINSLRFDEAYGKMLSSRNRMAAICAEHPGSAFDADGHLEYGIRAETPQYAYLFRCNRNDKAYSYCWCYEKQWLDRHLSQASRGIPFWTVILFSRCCPSMNSPKATRKMQSSEFCKNCIFAIILYNESMRRRCISTALPGTPGQRISDLCIGNRIAYKELAEKIGVSASQLNRIVSSETRTVSSGILIGVAKEFKVSI